MLEISPAVPTELRKTPSLEELFVASMHRSIVLETATV